MSKTRHSKKRFKQKVDQIREARQRLADTNDVTALSTLKAAFSNEKKAAMDLIRHPKGTKASGLRKEFKGIMTVASFRNRFGEAEEQSSRLRRYRRNAIHSMRNRLKKDIRLFLEDIV